MSFKEYLLKKKGLPMNEAKLSRLVKHMDEHETGMLTAFRGEFSKKDNKKRNASLLMKLQNKGYGVISVKGSYIENYGSSDEKEVGENVFFVIDLKDKGNIKKDLKKLGEEFDQDSILYIPKGGGSSDLIGTSKRDQSFPGYGKTVKNSKRMMGSTGQFFTRIKGRPFTFAESLVYEEFELKDDINWKMGRNKGASMHWSKLDIDSWSNKII